MITDWSKCPAVEVDPERCSGALTLKGNRTMLSTVFANIGNGGIDELIRQYHFNREDIEEVMEFLAASVEAEPSEPRA